MNIKDLTKEKVLDASNSSNSIKEFLEKLGFVPNNGQYRRAKTIAQHFQIELPVYDYTKATINASARTRIADEIYFAKETNRNGQALKARLIKDYGWVDKCNIKNCPNPLPVWNGLPIVLQLDHIDGDNTNNLIPNLRIICPNCHTQTETYSNKKRKTNG
jgi:hypothetical protein